MALFFVDSLFPVTLFKWDPRLYIAALRRDHILASLRSLIAAAPLPHASALAAIEPHPKDGGAFLRFSFHPPHNTHPLAAQQDIERALRAHIAKHGGLQAWTGFRRGQAWLVKGAPWTEDMARFASPAVRFTFDGPHLDEESLYALLRPCGHLIDLHPPSGTPTSTLAFFNSFRAAVIARNTLHNITLPVDGTTTRIRAAYERPLRPHVLRDWLSSHPRVVLPALVFILGTVSYQIFEPIRTLMIQANIEHWSLYHSLATLFPDTPPPSSSSPPPFPTPVAALSPDDDEKEHPPAPPSGLLDITRTLGGSLSTLAHTLGARGPDADREPALPADDRAVLRERREAAQQLHAYLSDLPSTIAFVYGPQGSGKTRMVENVLRESGRKTLTIALPPGSPPDAALLRTVTAQTGYAPAFPFLASLSALLDVAAVGLTGQRAGLAAPPADQLRAVLRTAGAALAAVRRRAERTAAAERQRQTWREEDAARARERRRGTWRDGRLDCVAGSGVMCELGGGDEPACARDWDAGWAAREAREKQAEAGAKERAEDGARRERSRAVPVVVLRNFAARGAREDAVAVFAEWAADLAQNQIAHVVVVSDNRENAKRLAKALPSKPLTAIALSDADPASALAFVRQRLGARAAAALTPAEEQAVAKLGGRASDLDSLVHKVQQGGAPLAAAVDELVARGVGEVRAAAFGADAEDARALPWAREHAWAVVRALARASAAAQGGDAEVGYFALLIEPPFGGEEGPLREMERAELIGITAVDGRPATIRPGKPLYRYVFERLVSDPVFRASQDLALTARALAAAEDTVAACERELAVLQGLARARGWGWGWGAEAARRRHVGERMARAEGRVRELEREQSALRAELRAARA